MATKDQVAGQCNLLRGRNRRGKRQRLKQAQRDEEVLCVHVGEAERRRWIDLRHLMVDGNDTISNSKGPSLL